MQHSDSLGKLAKALAAFQAAIKDPARDGTNPHFGSKYVPIDRLLAAIRPEASKHGLSIIQSTGGTGQEVSVSTMILHDSGEWIETEALAVKPQQSTPQGCMSAVTYSRRYSLSAALGVAWDDDDDGNAASTPAPKAPAPKKASQKSLDQIYADAKTLGIKPEDMKEIMVRHYGKSKSGQLFESEALDLIQNIEKYSDEIKADEEILMGN